MTILERIFVRRGHPRWIILGTHVGLEQGKTLGFQTPASKLHSDRFSAAPAFAMLEDSQGDH